MALTLLTTGRVWVKSVVLSVSRYCSNHTMPSALLIVADGVEEMEAVITADVLRRAEVNVTIAGLKGADSVKCSRDVVIKPDTGLADAAGKQFDIVVLPGGAVSAESFAASKEVGDVLKKQESSGKWIGSICASPIALNSHGIGKGKKLTSHPGVQARVQDNYKYSEDRVAIDGKLITSRGPGTCFEFSLAIVEALQGKEKRDSLLPPMLLRE